MKRDESRIEIDMDIFDKEARLFEIILDNITDAICVVDRNYIVKFWNKSAEDLYRISRDKILNKKIVEFFPNALLPKVIRERKPYENVYNSPKKGCHNIISARPLYNASQFIGAVSCDKDITELMRISQLLRKTKSNLQVLEQEVTEINENRFSFSQIVGNNIKFKEMINFSRSIAKSNINILLSGESGTGKEVFSRAIHIESNRKGYFIPINCSAIPSELMESELFGYEGGAFTGALKKGKIGKFELADKGTLFLDEIGDMPLKMQPKILRVLEDGIITKVGSDKPIKVDVRVIAATNKDVSQLVEKGLFRKDLYFRLNSVVINLPPLRERKDDIPLLVNRFNKDFCLEYRTNIIEISPRVMEMLINYDWEGNIRELKNIVERMVILSKNKKASKVDISFLPESIVNKNKGNIGITDKKILDLNLIVAEAEKEAIFRAMIKTGGNKAKAAKLLNIPRSTLYFKLDKYEIER